MRLAKPCAALAAAVLAAVASAPAFAQRALVDYESSAKAAAVREAAEWRLAFRPSIQVLRQTVAQLRAAPGASPEATARADAILKISGFASEADERKALTEAATLLRGKAWSADQQALEALALKTSTPVFGGGHDQVSVEALYPAPPIAGRYRIDLYRSAPTTSATPRKGALVKTIAEGQLTGGRQSIPLDLASAPDGAYLLIGAFTAGPASGSPSAQSVYVLHDLAARHAALTHALKPVRGHEAAKASAEYPFVLAAALQAGTREIVSYDFPKAMARSGEIARDLTAGRDPVRRAIGLQNRTYRLAEAGGELVPYQLYVPSHWTPDRQWPLVVALHGANLDETNMLGRAGGEMQKLAEQYGYVVVAPLGYKLNSGYGSLRMPKALLPEELRRRQLSEADVLALSTLIENEYRIDPRRRYLTGNSMGGGGTWWIGGHHPERWAAIAPGAYGGVLAEDVPTLKTLPILAVVGDHDELGMLDAVRASVATLRAGGAEPGYIEVKGGTHAGAFDAAMPQIFKFFSEHHR